MLPLFVWQSRRLNASGVRSLLLLKRKRSSDEKMDDNCTGSFSFFGLPSSECFYPMRWACHFISNDAYVFHSNDCDKYI